MRELKFRAWNEVADRYSKPFGFASNVLSYTDDDGLGVVKSLTDEVVEQYTGLKDKNGKEIYEGDIVNVMGTKTVGLYTTKIIWSKQGWTLDFNHTYLNNDSCIVRVEIIGNIHETPELINQA